MDLNKEILRESDSPTKKNKGIICYNYEDSNFIYNFPTSFIENRRRERRNEAVGVWKRKQLKK